MNEAENRAEDGAKTTQRTEQVRMGREITIQCFLDGARRLCRTYF